MFITFEGGEGAGKTTQIGLLAERLNQTVGRDLLVTREPGGTALGGKLRHLALHAAEGVEIVPRAELLIMLADRAQHVEEVIAPRLRAGGIVLCDRFADSSAAYQGYGRGLSIHEIRALNDFATGNLYPDLTVLLDIDPAVGVARQQRRSRMEDEALSFHQRVRAGFLSLAQAEPKRYLVYDASRPAAVIHEDIWIAVKARLALG